MSAGFTTSVVPRDFCTLTAVLLESCVTWVRSVICFPKTKDQVCLCCVAHRSAYLHWLYQAEMQAPCIKRNDFVLGTQFAEGSLFSASQELSNRIVSRRDGSESSSCSYFKKTSFNMFFFKILMSIHYQWIVAWKRCTFYWPNLNVF